MATKKTRRKFIKNSIKAGAMLPLLSTGLYSCGSDKQAKKDAKKSTDKKLNILILGGTSFLGPHQVAYALGRGHSVSIFTRGKTKPSIHQDLFQKVEHLVGDRVDNLSALENRKWDAVIDNSGRKADWTKRTAKLLKDNCELYLYTSSTGVYYPYLTEDIKESNEVLLNVPEETKEEELMEYEYGVMKANSEEEARKAFGKDRTIVVRPTYMIGPADKTNRFIHWPIRLSKGGETLVPGKADDPVQYIDVRDVADWMIRLIEEKKAGTYNGVGPQKKQNIRGFVEEAQKAFDVKSSFVQIDDYDFLIDNEVYFIVPWIMPSDNNSGSAKISFQKSKDNGLSTRPLTDTMKETLAWWNSEGVSQEQRDKVSKDPKGILQREKEIIKKWKIRNQ